MYVPKLKQKYLNFKINIKIIRFKFKNLEN